MGIYSMLVYGIVAVIVIPVLFGIGGIWLAIIFAETEVPILTAYCLKRYKAKYNY